MSKEACVKKRWPSYLQTGSVLHHPRHTNACSKYQHEEEQQQQQKLVPVSDLIYLAYATFPSCVRPILPCLRNILLTCTASCRLVLHAKTCFNLRNKVCSS